MKIKAPCVVMYNGAYHPPGTEIDLPDDEALSLIDRHGLFDGEASLSQSDLDGIDTLNRMHAIFGGSNG